MDLPTDVREYHPDPSIAPLTIQQLRQIYQQHLDHQRQETQAAQAQATLLIQQLDNEAAARQGLQVSGYFAPWQCIAGMPTSGDLKSRDYLFFYFPPEN